MSTNTILEKIPDLITPHIVECLYTLHDEILEKVRSSGLLKNRQNPEFLDQIFKNAKIWQNDLKPKNIFRMLTERASGYSAEVQEFLGFLQKLIVFDQSSAGLHLDANCQKINIRMVKKKF